MRLGRRLLAGLAMAAVLMAAPAALAQTQGGEVTVALYANTSSIDPNFSASHITRSILFGVYEGLVTVDKDTNVIPMLAKSWTVSDDGLVYTFELRQGVKFHNGKEMTSADAKASLERFARLSPDRVSMAPVVSIEAPSPYQVVITLKEVSPSFLSRLASPANPSSIVPAEEAAKGLNETANIGTGPFKIAEWVPDSHATLERFADYVPNPDFDGPTGFGGKKTAYLDRVTFRIMTEASTRVAALEAGEVQLAEDIPVPAAARLRTEPSLTVYQIDSFNMPVLFVNHAGAPTDNLKFRQAVQAALDLDQIMAGGTDGLYTLDASWLWPGNPYYSDAGKAAYNINDMAKAKAILAESGYTNEPVTLLIPNISFHIKIGAVLTEQLRELGLNILPQQVDYATLIATTQTDQGWNLAINGFSSAPFLGAFAYQSTFTGPTNWARIKSDPAMETAWHTFNTSLDETARKAAWATVQELSYQNVQTIKLGNQGFLIAASNKLKGYDPYIGGERMWNVWVE